MKLQRVILSYLLVLCSFLQSYDDTQINHSSIYNTSSTSPAIYNLGGESSPITPADKPNGKLDDLDVDEDVPDDQQVSPLIVAAQDNNYVKMQELLDLAIKQPVDINMQDQQGKTALHYAAFHDSDRIAKLLLDAGANLNISDNEGFTPLHVAVDQNSFIVARMLVDAGADRSMQTFEEVKTPLDFAHNDRMKNILVQHHELVGA